MSCSMFAVGVYEVAPPIVWALLPLGREQLHTQCIATLASSSRQFRHLGAWVCLVSGPTVVQRRPLHFLSLAPAAHVWAPSP